MVILSTIEEVISMLKNTNIEEKFEKLSVFDDKEKIQNQTEKIDLVLKELSIKLAFLLTLKENEIDVKYEELQYRPLEDDIVILKYANKNKFYISKGAKDITDLISFLKERKQYNQNLLEILSKQI